MFPHGSGPNIFNAGSDFISMVIKSRQRWGCNAAVWCEQACQEAAQNLNKKL